MKNKKLLYVAIVVAFVVSFIFIIINFSGNKYTRMEKNLVKASEKYLGLYPGLYPKTDSLVLTSKTLKSKGYDIKLYKNCSGYVIIKKNSNFYKYNPYIKCEGYTTKGYESKYDE